MNYGRQWGDNDVIIIDGGDKTRDNAIECRTCRSNASRFILMEKCVTE